jgi:coiled-coil domain-containing protein 55
VEEVTSKARHTMKLSFSLAGAKAKPKTASSVGAAPPLKKPAAFSALEDDSELVADAAPGIGDHRDVSANKRLLAQSAGAGSSKAQKKRMEAERQVDATVFEYDEVYDHMKAAKERQKASKDKDQDGTKRQVCCQPIHYCLDMANVY